MSIIWNNNIVEINLYFLPIHFKQRILRILNFDKIRLRFDGFNGEISEPWYVSSQKKDTSDPTSIVCSFLSVSCWSLLSSPIPRNNCNHGLVVDNFRHVKKDHSLTFFHFWIHYLLSRTDSLGEHKIARKSSYPVEKK